MNVDTKTPLQFAIADTILPPPAQLPAVIDARPIDKAVTKIRGEVVKASAVDGPMNFVISGSAMFGGLGLVTSTVMTGLAAAMGDFSMLPFALTAVGSSTALLGSTVPLWRGRNFFANRKVERAVRADVEQLVGAFSLATGVERSFLAVRALVMYREAGGTLDGEDKGNLFWRAMDRTFPSFGSYSLVQRLRPLAAAAAELPEEERQRLFIADTLCTAVEVHPDWVEANLERHLASLGALNQEERDLVRLNIMGPVLAELDKDPGNTWRRARFLDALDGKTTPYTTETIETAPPELTLASLRKDWEEKKAGPCTNVAEAIAVITRGLGKGKGALCSISDAKVAEQTAAYFERRDLAASIYKRSDGIVRLAVYDPARPSEARFLMGTQTS